MEKILSYARKVQQTLNLDTVGLIVGTLFFAFSLTPSLLPRPLAIQGLISGLSFAAGYGLGVAAVWLYYYLQMPAPPRLVAGRIKMVTAVVCALVALSFLWQAGRWQNALRELMGMEEAPGGHPILLGLIAAIVFLVMLGVGRLFQWTCRLVSHWLDKYLPRRVSRLCAVAAAIFLFWSVIDGVLFRVVLIVADRSFQQLDALIEDDLPRPAHAWQTGSAESVISWEELGRQGRRFVSGGPTAEELGAFFGEPVPAPLRVYVGLNSAGTPEERARLAMEELKRVGGFERSILLLVTPTGTGWVDPSSQDTIEYLHRGDIATVSAQYSYLNSPLALITQSAYGVETARAMFREVYGHWRTLPKESRPRLFLRGLSLGSRNSDLSFDLYDIIDDPFDGALWSGPPFSHETWGNITNNRDEGSPAWLPQFRGGAVVRFMNQDHGLDRGNAEWGAFRIAFLQYASDPIIFFSTRSAWREPAWMREPRGPDVSPNLRWFPVVTMLQLAADMMVGTAPKGFGHEYAATDYISAWLALTEPPDWTNEERDRLRAKFE